MSKPEQIDIFVENNLRNQVEKGRHSFLQLVSEVLSDAGMTPNFRLMRERYDFDITQRSLMHMKAPASPDGLVFRCVYHMPFWQIETTEKRWDWSVAQADFDPTAVNGDRALRFYRNWKIRLFPNLEPKDEGYIYVPLQGRLLDHRSFQSCSPVTMVKTLLSQTDRPVVLALHPKETYSDQESSILAKLADSRPDVTLTTGEMATHLPNCSLIVTQNSSVAFNGYLFAKPAVLFGKIDFHHIGLKATPDTLADALQLAETHAPDFAAYLWWFWQINSINAGRPNFKDKIRKRLVSYGWPVG